MIISGFCSTDGVRTVVVVVVTRVVEGLVLFDFVAVDDEVEIDCVKESVFWRKKMK